MSKKSKSLSYEIKPKIQTYPVGTIFKAKQDIMGTNAAGINEADENYEYGAEEILIEKDSILTFVEDKQFMASNKDFSLSAWVRFHFVVNEQIVWTTIYRDYSRIWDFDTYRGRERKIKSAVNEMFEMILSGDNKK